MEKTQAELGDMTAAYVKVLDALDKQAKAEDAYEKAKQDVSDAEKNLSDASATLEQAKAEKEKTADLVQRASVLSVEAAIENPITDEAFTYLNDYIERLKTAESRQRQSA